MVSMFGCRCYSLPACLPVVPTFGSSSAATIFYSEHGIAISNAAYSHHLQARSIVKPINSVISVRKFCQWERLLPAKNARRLHESYFRIRLVELQFASSRKNPLSVSLLLCSVAEREGEAFVNREKPNSMAHDRNSIGEKTVFPSKCSNLLALEDGKLDQAKKVASPCSKDDKHLIENKEKQQRGKSTCKNHGNVPWNKGKKHSPETIELIRLRTSQAMLQPAVREKMRQNASKPMREATKAKIKKSLLKHHATRRKMKLCQLACLNDWKDQVSDVARIGVAGEEELHWNSYSELKMKSKLEYARELRAFQRAKKQGFRELVGHSKDHRKSISEAMRKKWKDRDYRTRVCMGIRNHLLTHRSSSNSEKRLTVKLSNMIDYSSSSRVANQNQQNGNGLSANIVLSQEVAENVDRAFATEVMMGEALLTLSKKPFGVNGHFSKALGSCVVDDNLLFMSEEPICDGKDGEASATGHAVNPFGSNAQDSEPEIPFTAKGCLYVDSKASEKLEKLRMLQASRLFMEMKKKEAAERACLLMMEAEKAAKALEDAAKSNKFAKASLDETRRLLAEAAQSMKTIESKKHNILSPMQHEKTSWYATDRPNTSSLRAAKTSCNSSDACQKSTHQSPENNAEVDPKMPLGSNGPSDIFDLIDSWIINEDLEKFRTSPLTSIGRLHNPRKISWVQPGLCTTSNNAINLSNVHKESLTFTFRCQNMNYVSSISAIASLRKNNCVEVNWTISKQPKGLKRWHFGRLVNVENDELC